MKKFPSEPLKKAAITINAKLRLKLLAFATFKVVWLERQEKVGMCSIFISIEPLC